MYYIVRTFDDAAIFILRLSPIEIERMRTTLSLPRDNCVSLRFQKNKYTADLLYNFVHRNNHILMLAAK